MFVWSIMSQSTLKTLIPMLVPEVELVFQHQSNEFQGTKVL